MFSSTRLAINYAIYALIATAANIGAQEIVVRLYSGAFDILASVIVGTGVGLVVKYILDKRYIFRFQARSVAHDTQTFALYTVMGLATTLVFWGFEFGFHHLFETKEMRYLGGLIGLAIGYLTKFHLDKRYVIRFILGASYCLAPPSDQPERSGQGP
jgi:putative flippase GtrA